jgi:hypothetical protein
MHLTHKELTNSVSYLNDQHSDSDGVVFHLDENKIKKSNDAVTPPFAS